MIQILNEVDEEFALIELLKDGVLFANDIPFDGAYNTVLYVSCNDLFDWACAEAESFSYLDIKTLYEMHLKDKKWGSSKWCCFHRNLKPQKAVIEAMKKDGVWDETMEALQTRG